MVRARFFANDTSEIGRAVEFAEMGYRVRDPGFNFFGRGDIDDFGVDLGVGGGLLDGGGDFGQGFLLHVC